jgi:hypothetical protein
MKRLKALCLGITLDTLKYQFDISVAPFKWAFQWRYENDPHTIGLFVRLGPLRLSAYRIN